MHRKVTIPYDFAAPTKEVREIIKESFSLNDDFHISMERLNRSKLIAINIYFYPKEYYSKDIRRKSKVRIYCDKKDRLDIDGFSLRKIQPLKEFYTHDQETYNKKQEKIKRTIELEKEMQEALPNLLPPEGFQILSNFYMNEVSINLILNLKNVDQVKRVMDFVNHDNEMGAERMIRVLEKNRNA